MKSCVLAVVLALAVASPAAAVPSGYTCEASARLGPDRLTATRTLNLHSQRWFSELQWAPRSGQAEVHGVRNVALVFAEPSTGDAALKPQEIRLGYTVRGAPTSPAWLVVRLGEAAATRRADREDLFRQVADAPGAPLYGFSARLRPSGLPAAYAQGGPLEIHLQRTDGRVLQSWVDPLQRRSEAEATLRRLWQDVLRSSADYQSNCTAVDIEE